MSSQYPQQRLAVEGNRVQASPQAIRSVDIFRGSLYSQKSKNDAST
eukprot:CAMPEP_0185589220 /NCGR_PEP_ID=MMETSP0434-20130131/56048_1 /TAXON_ID=626734 ORGANISM="Favella taraikaensis, Strain Fe Narragansett Bay" /NCGR_SAMPLE_ID=MMETSP0434 /ASSEMBLY_ACC=CAM_ASM_000379 /LENGTH=45 /DNA_ID= /DNA_START= /DNA_END= /DNA_ORIENTATION=